MAGHSHGHQDLTESSFPLLITLHRCSNLGRETWTEWPKVTQLDRTAKGQHGTECYRSLTLFRPARRPRTRGCRDAKGIHWALGVTPSRGIFLPLPPAFSKEALRDCWLPLGLPAHTPGAPSCLPHKLPPFLATHSPDLQALACSRVIFRFK